MALSRVVSKIFNVENVVTLKSGSEATQDHRKWCHLIECKWFPIKSSILTLSDKMHRFLDIRLVTIQWPWNPGYGSLKVIGTDTDRFATYNFLLTFRCNRGPISYRFRDIRQFQSKIANFSQPPSTLHPRWSGSPWNWVPVLVVKKTWMMGYWEEKEVWRYLHPSG